MRASRLLSILLMLQTRGRLTADQLAATFEVSVRTVYRDIEQLKDRFAFEPRGTIDVKGKGPIEAWLLRV